MLGIQIGNLFIRDNAYHLPSNLRTELRLSGNNLLDQNAFSNRILIGQIFSRQGLIDYGDRRRSGHVVIVQTASLPHSDPERMEVGGS